MKYLMLFESYTSHQEKLMDELLDKISNFGMDSLSPEEKNMLKNLDTIESPEVKKLMSNDDAENSGEYISGFSDATAKDFLSGKNVINKKYFDTTKQICFLLKQILDDKDDVIYAGEIHFKGVIYNGYMSKHKETESSMFAFIEDDGKEFDPTEYDLHYEFDDLIQEVFYDENTNSNIS